MLAIRYHRQRRGLSQKALADLTGTTQPKVSLIERGHLCPNDELLGRIAQALGTEPAFALLRPVVIREQQVSA